MVEFEGFYNIPGEGLVVELREGQQTFLYTKQGLQYRILARKKNSLETTTEEHALAQMNSLLIPQGI